MKKMNSFRLDPVADERLTSLSAALKESKSDVLEDLISVGFDIYIDSQTPDNAEKLKNDMQRFARSWSERLALAE